MKKLFLSAILLSTVLGGCKKKTATLPCVRGTLLGTTCDNGFVVQVDTTSQQLIGTSLNFKGDAGPALTGPAAKLRTYANVVILYSPQLPTMPRGQQFYFQYSSALTDSPLACPPSALTYSAPRFVPDGQLAQSCTAFLPE